LVGAGSGAQYEFLESEGDPLAAGRGALIGAPVGAGVSKAMEAAAEPLGRLFRGEVPVPKIGPDATNTIVGGTLGGIAPAETAEERAQNIALGAGLGAAARTGSRMLDDLTSPRVASVEVPKTPAQAVRFETPGSPEYEAAVAKGLDMSQAGRMGRREAWEANAHPDVKSSKWYHGTSKTDLTQLNRMPRGTKAKSDYSSEQGGMNRLGIWLSNRADEHGAEMYAGETGVIMPVVPRAKNPYVIQGSATPRAGQDKAFEEFYDFIRKLTPNAKGHPSMRNMEPVRKWLKENGYDSVILKNTYGDSPGLEKVPQDMLIVLDDGNIRSINAAFDPDKAASPILTAGPGGYFGRQSMRPPGSGPSAREIETQQQWATATPIVTQARTTAQSAQQAADAALQSKAPADIARAKDQKKTLVSQLQEAQASRAGMDTPEDARLAETLASLTENTSDPVLLSTQISAAKTSLDRLLTDIGSPSEGNLIPVKTNILTRTQAPRSAAEGPQDRASVTRYAEGEAPPIKGMGFAGPRAKGADLDALQVAQQQVAAGRTPQEVWSETGWYQAKDGKWTFEIDDSAARIANPNGKKLDQFLSHPTLFKNYPSLRGVRVEVNPQKVRPGEAYYDRVGNKMVLGSADIDSAIHEIQHLIQKREGRLQITNPDAFDYQKLKAAGIEGDPAAGVSRRDAAYNRSLSETEARASADRRGMSAEERAATFPEQSYDVAPEDVLGTTRKLIRSPFAAPFAAVGGVGAGTATEGDAKTQENDLRPDGTLKGTGFLGPLPIRMPDGSSSVATEYSIGVNIDGRDLLIPTLVPTLTADQQRQMVEDIIPNNKKVPQDIVNTATQHALMRMRKGLSPFANNDDD